MSFVLPALLVFAVFALWPTYQAFEYSFVKWDGISPSREWVGLANYIRLFNDRIFWQAFAHTLQWTGTILVINIGLGLVVAATLARIRRARLFLQTCFMVPLVLAPITVAIIWRWLYQPEGVINSLLAAGGLGFLARPWLGDPSTTLTAIAVAHSWSTLGLSVIIFLAGLQAIDEEIFEAASLDGANAVQTFRHITAPALRPIAVVVVILTVTDAFKAFDLIWAMTRGGPARASEILSTYMFKRGVQENQYGYGSAIAVTLLIVVTLAMAAYVWQQRRRVE